MPTLPLDEFVRQPSPRELDRLDPHDRAGLEKPTGARKAAAFCAGIALLLILSGAAQDSLDLFSQVFLGGGLLLCGLGGIAVVRGELRRQRTRLRLLREGRVTEGRVLASPPPSSSKRPSTHRSRKVELPLDGLVQQLSLLLPPSMVNALADDSPVLLLHHPDLKESLWVFPDGSPPVPMQLGLPAAAATRDDL